MEENFLQNNVDFTGCTLGILNADTLVNAHKKLRIPEPLVRADIWLSRKAYEHIHNDHPNDLMFAMRFLHHILNVPDYLGYDRNAHEDSFYLVKKSEKNNKFLFVSLYLKKDTSNCYGISTAYTIKKRKLDNKIKAGVFETYQRRQSPFLGAFALVTMHKRGA